MLKVINEPLSKPMSCFEGKHSEPCRECDLNSICSRGCNNAHYVCSQRTCYRECNDCGGGPILKNTGANVPAVCCKAPLKDVWLTQVKKENYFFKPRKLITLKQRSIIVTQGSPGRVDGCPYPKEASAIAVNLRHVWSTRGWFSQDMRDYLKIDSPKTKLILLTATHDDVLERAWSCGVQHEDFKSLGFNYWQALEFSQYGEYSRFNNIWQGYRSLYAVEASRAYFSTQFPDALRVVQNKESYHPWYECGQAIPQFIINWQFTSLRDKDSYRAMVASIMRYIKRVPVKSLWFMGVLSSEMVYNLQRAFLDYTCYFMSVTPWLAAHKGSELSMNGKIQKSKLPKTELVLLNQRNYANLVSNAVSSALDATKP